MINGALSEDMDEKSVLDEMNPAVKLFCLVFLSVSYILVDSPFGHLFAFVFLLALIYLSQLDFSVITSAFKRLFSLLFFIFILNFCFCSEKNTFFRWWVFAPSAAGALRGLAVSIKVMEIVVIFDIFNTLTDPMSLISTLAWSFRPISLLGIAHEQIAITVSSSFWFLKLLKNKFDEISVMQKNSGVYRKEGGSQFDSAGKIRLLMPVLYESFYTARERAVLLEARGVPECIRKNSNFPTGICFYDYCAMTVCTAFFAVQLIIF